MKYFKVLLIIFVFLISAAGFQAAAQTLPQNLSGFNVDQYSDAQIRQLLQQAQSQGLNDAQLIQLAQSRGLPPDQVARLQERITSLRKTPGSASPNANDTTQTRTRQLNYQPDTSNKKDQTIDINNSLKPKIFGADLFRNTNISSTPNLQIATPVNYVLGPKDQVLIDVYGNSVANWRLTVTPEGNINIPGAGVLNVSGKTIEQATASIKSKLAANNYAVDKGTKVSVNLGNIRSIKVIVVGEVVRPNTYTLPSLASVFDALYASGGPSDKGSFRQIEIIRNSQVIRRMDVYDFLVSGSQKDNILLQDHDIIRIPTYRTRVEMSGEVKIPALFEVMPGETLQDVIRFAGGFTDQAYTELIKVVQISGQQYKMSDIIEGDFKNYVPLRGDKYIVDAILSRFENRVTIKGAVFRPGDFELEKGMTISRLIAKAEGLKEDAFTGRGSIIRLKADNTTEQISFDVNGIMNKTAPDITLQREDVVNISSIFDLRDKYTVNIKGEVRNPGEFAYANNMQVEDLIIKAGGFNEGASAKRIEVARRVDNSDPKAENARVAQVFTVDLDPGLKIGATNFTLKPFDIVSIYSLPGYEKQKTVLIEGEVLYPGPYTIEKKNEKISDLIKRAGGLTASADVEGSSLKRSNTAVLGSGKNKIDTAAVEKERMDRLRHLQNSYRDSSKTDPVVFRNDYVGIDLKKILDKPNSKIDLILEDGDVLRVPKEQQIVRVNGAVLYPSAVVYDKGKSFKGYVLNAGGFAPNAYRGGAYVVYPNGTVKGTRKFLFFNIHPSVRNGSEIYVPLKPEHKGLSTSEVIGITTGVASLGAIILGILNIVK